MKFKYLNLKKVRKNFVSVKKTEIAYPARRRFVKTAGLTALAWNPLFDSLKKLDSQNIKFHFKNNLFQVLQQNKTVWEISEKYFECGFSLHYRENQDFVFINASELKYKGTYLKFSVKCRLNKQGNESVLSIPEFNFTSYFNLSDWIEGTKIIEGDARINSKVLNLSNTDKLNIEGAGKLRLMPDWQIQLITHNAIEFHYNHQIYKTNKIQLQSTGNTHNEFLTTKIGGFTTIRLTEFTSFENWVADTKISDGKFNLIKNGHPVFSLAIPHNKTDEKIIWVESSDSEISFQPVNVFSNQVIFEGFFYFAEYLNNNGVRNYLSANFGNNSFWAQNPLGSFQLESNKEFPDFEAFGTNCLFSETVFEPRLKAFKPNISDGVALAANFQDPKKVRIIQPQKKVTTTTRVNSAETQQSEQDPKKSGTRIITNLQITQPQRDTVPPPNRNLNFQRIEPTRDQNPQNPIRKIEKDQPQIKVEFDQIKFKPKKALSIKVLRPEDMVMLEFVFHNFNFTNKGQSPYLELDKVKEPGIVEIYFQSQHTLEEAYYESTPIPDSSGGNSESVTLPAKHIRARKSRLVYELPANHVGFPLIMEELLDWTKFSLRVHPRAWIKIPSIKKIRKPSRVLLDKNPQTKPNKNLKYLNTPQTEFGIKLAQNTKIKSNNLDVYQENEVGKLLVPDAATSVKPAFNTDILKKISWKVEPIPELSTSIEAPTLMYISPNQTNDFYHRKEVVFRDVQELTFKTQQQLNTDLRILDPLNTNKGEVSELWHTRLGVKLKNGKTSGTALPHFKTIRALWADDADEDYKVPKERNFPFMASLDANNRQKLVHTTSNYTAGFTPFPVPVNDLMLTTLGAYLDWHVFFDVPTPHDTYLNIIEWEHIATLGRDHFVKIVEEGYLFPFGHRAAVVKITERKFHMQTKAAVNRQRMFVVVLEKEVLYSRNDPKGEFIEFPFQAVRIETNQTPNIDNPEDSTLVNVPPSMNLSRTNRLKISGATGGNTMYNFYINVGGTGFPFDLIATDKEGQQHAFRMPLAFMENRIARDENLMKDVIKEYQGKNSNNFNAAYNETGFNGREVAYAEYLVEGDTAFETEKIKFDAQIYPDNTAGAIKFHPKMKEAKVFVKQINELTGIREPATIGLEDDNNKGGVFARVISSSVVDFSGGSDKAGGFMVPNMSISGLSKLQGPVSGALDDMKELLFIPEEFFAAFEDLPVAKIFGVIQIFDLLFGDSGSPFDLGGSFDELIDAVTTIREEIEDLKNEILYLENLAEETQQMVENQINEIKQLIKNKVNDLLSALNDSIPRIPNLKAYLTEEAFYAEYKWQPELGGNNIEIIPSLLNVKVNNPSTALSITTKFEKPFDAGKPASLNGLARFEKFGIDIVPLLAVNFNYLEFRTGSSEKTDVKVDIDKNNPIEFKGVLNFVNNLQSIIPSDGFSDSGPYINIKPTGVTAGFDIAIPNVEVGICMISNISLGANVTLPFTGAPLTLGFNFCKRENPFLLTVSCFGGGGYFMMVTTLKGIQSIEAAFEFGAAMSLNVGVASGGVSAMGGFYYKMEIVEGVEQTTLTGYLRLNGHLSILGLISLSLEFYLAFVAVIYQGKVQKLEGQATLKVKVEVLFFSKTVSVSVRRELKGADADPKFIEMIEPDDWQEYCLAFAG